MQYFNAVPLQNNFEEENAYHPEILKDLETTFHDNEDDDSEIEIFVCPVDDGVDDEEEN